MSDVEGAGNSAFIKKRRLRWAALIRKVYEVDPLRCPECDGEMKIISFIDKYQGCDLKNIASLRIVESMP